MSIATTIIDSAMNNASNLSSAATSALGTALSSLKSPMTVGYGTLTVTNPGASFSIGSAPAYTGLHYEAPAQTFGAAPVMELVPPSEYGEPPVLSAVNPGFSTPIIPAELHQLDATKPTLDSLYVPPAPDALYELNLIPPTLTNITVPPAPTVDLPEFMAATPDTTVLAPSDFAEKFAADYADMSVSMRNALDGAMDAHLLQINPEYHKQMAALEAKLSTYMSGGTALPVEVEQAIYNRARDKINGEYLKARDQIMKDGASRGFTIPGGAQYSALAQSRQSAADNNARAAMDIAIKQAEMEQTNIQFAITQSANLRTAVMQAMVSWFSNLIQLNGQSIEYAKSVLQAAIALYETMVKIAVARIEIYKAEAQVYEIRLKAVLAVYDVYLAEVKALEAQVNIDRARVDAFSAQANAYAALANAYKAVIDGVAAKANIEKLKVDIFHAEVQAFSAEVGAKQAEWQGFTAQVQGETAKLGAYETEVKAYSTEVQAYATQIQAYKTEVEAVTAKNEGAYRTYGAAVQAYTALVGGASEAVKAEVSAYSAEIQGYVALASAQEAAAKSRVAEYEATVRNQIGLYNTNAHIAVATMNGYNQYMTSAAQVAVSAAEVYASMAGSSLAGLNALAADIDTSTA